MIKYCIIIFATLLSLINKAQTWVAPAGGFYNNILFYNLYADDKNNALYRFGLDTNVLYNNTWQTWYKTNNIIGPASRPIPFSDGKNYFFKQYDEGGDQFKKRTALIRWSNSTDLDTVKIYKGSYGMCCQNVINGKFYVTVQHDTMNYLSYLAEFDGTNLKNLIFDTIWQGTNRRGIGQTITYKNEIYANGGFYDHYKIIVYRNNQWQFLPPWKGNDNGVIVSMFIYNDRLYFSGGFWQGENSTTPGNSVVAWDGTNWDDLGGGIEHDGLYLQGGANDAVVCNNKIYFVGPFDRAGKMKASKVVTWNDTSWCAVGGDLDSCFTISQIECFKDTVYIEGNLANVHGVNLGTIGKMQNQNYADSCKRIFTGITKYNYTLPNIKILPNPASSIVTIKNNGLDPVIKLQLSNSIGQSIYEIIKPDPELDISRLSSGVYYLKVETKNGQAVFKVLKE